MVRAEPQEYNRWADCVNFEVIYWFVYLMLHHLLIILCASKLIHCKRVRCSLQLACLCGLQKKKCNFFKPQYTRLILMRAFMLRSMKLRWIKFVVDALCAMTMMMNFGSYLSDEHNHHSLLYVVNENGDAIHNYERVSCTLAFNAYNSLMDILCDFISSWNPFHAFNHFVVEFQRKAHMFQHCCDPFYIVLREHTKTTLIPYRCNLIPEI